MCDLRLLYELVEQEFIKVLGLTLLRKCSKTSDSELSDNSKCWLKVEEE